MVLPAMTLVTVLPYASVSVLDSVDDLDVIVDDECVEELELEGVLEELWEELSEELLDIVLLDEEALELFLIDGRLAGTEELDRM